MLIGYARVSTTDQNLALQHDALTAAGCARLFTDEVTGSSTKRPGLDQALAAVAAGDTLVVWKLDRLGRSLAHLVQTIDELGRREIGFRSLSESIDTVSAGGRLVLHMMGALAQFELALIAERTRAGMQAAKRRGQKLGRRRLLTGEQVRHARKLIDAGESPRIVAKTLGVARSTLYSALNLHAPIGNLASVNSVSEIIVMPLPSYNLQNIENEISVVPHNSHELLFIGTE